MVRLNSGLTQRPINTLERFKRNENSKLLIKTSEKENIKFILGLPRNKCRIFVGYWSHIVHITHEEIGEQLLVLKLWNKGERGNSHTKLVSNTKRQNVLDKEYLKLRELRDANFEKILQVGITTRLPESQTEERCNRLKDPNTIKIYNEPS